MVSGINNLELNNARKMELEFLAEDQNEHFDQEYHSPEEMKQKIEAIRARFPAGPETILDIGGGNGRFLDGLLSEFKETNGYLIDLSEFLLLRNAANARKHLVQGSVDRLDEFFPSQKFDVITINWVLHHLVGQTWQRSVSNCLAALKMSARSLSPNGVIIVSENLFDDVFGGDLPSHIIYAITRAKTPAFVKLARRYFNTAGVGVCFHSQPAWEKLFKRANLKIEQKFFGGYWDNDLKHKLMLMSVAIKSRRSGHYILS